MALTVKHAKTDNIAAWTQTDLDAQIALGNFPPGTLINDIVLSTDWNNNHVLTGTYDSIPFNPTASPSYLANTLIADATTDSLTYYNSDSNVGLQIGQEEWIRVKNVSGSTIANGATVYINGANSGYPTIALAQSNAGATTICVGLATESIANNALGFVTCLGLVNGLDTSGFAAGATVYVSSTVAGGLTSTAPVAPNYRYRVGIVGTSNATVGTIHVTPSTASLGNGTANQVFGMNTAGTAQEVKTLAGGNNIVVAYATNSITFSGGQVQVAQTAHGFAVGDELKSNGTAGTYAKAQANSAANAEGVGRVITVIDANNFVYITEGLFTTGVPAATAGTVYFLDPAVAGGVTSTKPTTVGQVVKPLFTVITSGSIAVYHKYIGILLSTANTTLTKTIDLFNWAACPDTSGNVWFEPASVTQTNDRYTQIVARFRDTSTKDSLGIRFQVPPDFNASGTTTLNIVWATTATTGNAIWTLDYSSAAQTASLDPSADEQSLTVTTAAPGTSQNGALSTMTLTSANLAALDEFQGKISRNGAGSDTIAADLVIYRAYLSYSV